MMENLVWKSIVYNLSASFLAAGSLGLVGVIVIASSQHLSKTSFCWSPKTYDSQPQTGAYEAVVVSPP